MSQPHEPSPNLAFDTINAFRNTAAIKAAIELKIFSHIAAGATTPAALAARARASERGVRILCDSLTTLGFLDKSTDRYQLTADSAAFLDEKSPDYMGGVVQFLLAPEFISNFEHLTAAVRKGGTARTALGTLAPEHPVWIQFARAMAPLMIRPAHALAELLSRDHSPAHRVLDIAAGHGMWGIAFAQQNPTTHLVALDWAPVLAVARENAERAGLGERFSTISGSAFAVDLGSDYDVVLVPNFLHHFSAAECAAFLKKVRTALREGGRVAIAELVPNPDRVTPPEVAPFSLVMLASTPQGDAYTLAEFEQMLAEAGFQAPSTHPLPPSDITAIIAQK